MRSVFSWALSGLFTVAAIASPVEQLDERQFGKARTQIDSKTYQIISYYPAYSTAVYLSPFIQPCIWPFKSVLTKMVNVSSTDTQMGIFRNDNTKELVVGIPGLNSSADVFTTGNFGLSPYIAPGVNCPLCHVHSGWLVDWNSVASEVTNELNKQLKMYPNYPIVVAGHSMGGALCSLTYASLVALKYNVKLAVCSGSPRVGDAAYANYIDKLSGATQNNIGNYYRVTHYNDGVPQVPPQSAGYRHPQTEIFESAYNSTLGATYHCYGQEPGDCNDVTGAFQTINNAHETYAGVRYDCNNGYLPGPPNP